MTAGSAGTAAGRFVDLERGSIIPPSLAPYKGGFEIQQMSGAKLWPAQASFRGGGRKFGQSSCLDRAEGGGQDFLECWRGQGRSSMCHPYRAAAHSFAHAAALPNPTFWSPMPKQIAWHEVSARVLSVGIALEVPTADLDQVLADIALVAAGRSFKSSSIVGFASRHGVSIDFLIRGDLLPLIAGVRAGRPVMFA